MMEHGGRRSAPGYTRESPARPFVTAQQIASGPPVGGPTGRAQSASRQRELYELVFEDQKPRTQSRPPGGRPRHTRPQQPIPAGRRVWHFAVAGSALSTLLIVAVVGYATGIVGGGPAGAEPGDDQPPPAGDAEPGDSKPQQPKAKPLPDYPGEGSPVQGRLKAPALGLSYAKLGGAWQADPSPGTVKQKYGMNRAHFNQVGTDQLGQAIYARLMAGPAGKGGDLTDLTDLEKAAKSTAMSMKKKLYDQPAKGKQFATQPLTIGEAKGHLLGFKVKQAGQKADLMVVAAVDSGKQKPSAVFMLVPASATELRPDINAVIESIKIL